MRRIMNSAILFAFLFFGAMAIVAGQANAEGGHVCPPGGGTSESPCTAEATLTLSGTVTEVCNVELNALPKAQELDVVNGETDAHVADIRATSNSPNGAKLFLKSATGGLKNPNDLTASIIPVQFSVGGSPAVSSESAASQAVLIKEYSAGEAGILDVFEPVTVSFVGLGANAVPGTYQGDFVFINQAL